ncbi:Uncharacterised protein [Clostridioides difficile]|nr:Uncharacterised protein [Clostridioides difficile]
MEFESGIKLGKLTLIKYLGRNYICLFDYLFISS